MANMYAGGSYQSAPNNTLAVVSLISGILGLTLVPFLGSIVALVTGYMARNEIKNSNIPVGGDGLATAGMILGWIGVGFGVIGCCVGIAFFLIPVCLIPLGISFNQFGLVTPFITLFL